ncbi:hypothetical protein C0J45_3747 [Silurus meridionalis]|nr:hypothetical protein C0J45_3747 [Silurus meridionalis]
MAILIHSNLKGGQSKTESGAEWRTASDKKNHGSYIWKSSTEHVLRQIGHITSCLFHILKRKTTHFLIHYGKSDVPEMISSAETKWKWTSARNIGGGFKLFYYGVDGKRNGVGVFLKEEYSKSVVEVKRVSDRVMNMKLGVKGVMINVISDYVPQVGCEMEEKVRFWSELDGVVDGVPKNERLVIGADFNGHVGEGNRGDEDVMVVMERLTDEVRQKSPWTMMFADDIVICGESSEQVKKSLERWRYTLERREMKVSRSKTEYMCLNEREGSGVVQLQGEEVEKVVKFRCRSWFKKMSTASIALQVAETEHGLTVLRPYTAHCNKSVCMPVIPEESLF